MTNIITFILTKHFVFKSWSNNHFLGITFSFKGHSGTHKAKHGEQRCLQARMATVGISAMHTEAASSLVFCIYQDFCQQHFFFNSCNHPPLQPPLNRIYSMLTSSHGNPICSALELRRFPWAKAAYLIASVWILIFDAGRNTAPFSIPSPSNYVIICAPFFFINLHLLYLYWQRTCEEENQTQSE